MRSVPESDWKVFTKVSPVAMERFCERVLDEGRNVLADASKSSHERYLALYQLMGRRDKELAQAFHDYRRSTAFWQIAIMYNQRLLTEEEFMQFSPETRNSILAMRENSGS